MIKNIILDIGMVLVNFDRYNVIDSLGFEKLLYEKVVAATVDSKQWCEFDRGLLSYDEIVEMFYRNAPDCKKEIDMVMSHILDMVVEYEYSTEWIKELKGNGWKVYLLSNFPKEMFVKVREKMEFYHYIDGSVISYEVHKIKPELDIYHILLQKYHLIPKECLFIDDVEVNIQAAKECGINGVLFQNIEQVKLDLMKF